MNELLARRGVHILAYGSISMILVRRDCIAMSSEAANTPGDIAAVWEVKLPDGKHNVVFEHGTTSGKRVINVDGKEIFRKNWMFRLVGSESFQISKRSAVIAISSNGLTFEYLLTIDGKSLQKFVEAQAKNTRVWLPKVDGDMGHRVVLDMETMDVYVDGRKVETVGEFTDDGCETHFSIQDQAVYIKTSSSGQRLKGLVRHLVVGDTELLPVKEGM